MKKLLKIIIFLCVYNLQAQEGVIVPTGSLESIKVENGTYIKDVDNSFNSFVGTYVGTWNNKQVIIIIQKKEHVTFSYPSGSYYYEDRMVGTYKIIDLTNSSILYSDLEATEYNDFPIVNISDVHNGELEFDFNDKLERCRRGMQFQLYKMITSAGITTVRYWGRDSASYAYDCINPTDYLVPIMPLGFLTLTKVN